MYDVRVTKLFEKQFKKVDKQTQRNISKEIEVLRNNPEVGEKLKGILQDLWRTRTGDYRIVYRIYSSSNTIEIIYVGHRKHVYEELERLRRQELI